MKKFGIIALAALLVVAFTMPAAALENVFGGYWRTRAYTQSDFDGDGTEDNDISKVDTRTRLYYTAILNDNLKFVNKFEWNTTWGDEDGGDIGADAADNFRIKNSYVDFNIGSFNTKIGQQGVSLGRDFLFSDDVSAAVINYKTDTYNFPFYWMKAYEGGIGKDDNDFDVDMYGINPKFKMDSMSIQPFIFYATSDDAAEWLGIGPPLLPVTEVEIDIYWIGLNFDVNFDAGSLWFTGIYQTGEIDTTVVGVGSSDEDLDAYLVALGGSIPLGKANVHGQVFYASGDDDPLDDDVEEFFGMFGDSYYWAEIMGLGIFDNQASNGAPADKISNITAANIGVSFKATDKLKLTADLWYAVLAEDDAFGEDELGVEIDLKATYQLVENLNLEVVAAFLSAGDATSSDGSNDEDPMEIGARLSLSF